MGTNFYVKVKSCDTCEHKPENIHLGKSSAGWQFSFQYNGGRFYKNVEEMREWLKGKLIFNEYGSLVPQEEFWEMVAEKQTPENTNHAAYCHEKYPEMKSEHVIDGYSFSDCYFS